MKTYIINEIFYSLQGEGARAGSANVFVRFAGCNLTCKLESHGFDCDTEFVSGRKMSLREILQEMKVVGGKCQNVILTGGEPLLQVGADEVQFLKGNGWFVAMETNGTLPAPTEVDWLTVSPKVAEHALRQLVAHEVKYVKAHGQGIPKTQVTATHRYYISPAWGPEIKKNLAWCIELVKENPEWTLSLQQHKIFQVR